MLCNICKTQGFNNDFFFQYKFDNQWVISKLYLKNVIIIYDNMFVRNCFWR